MGLAAGWLYFLNCPDDDRLNGAAAAGVTVTSYTHSDSHTLENVPLTQGSICLSGTKAGSELVVS